MIGAEDPNLDQLILQSWCLSTFYNPIWV